MNKRILYLPVARLTFDVTTAENYFQDSIRVLQQVAEHVIVPTKILTDVAALKSFITAHIDEAELVVLQNITFTDGAFIQQILDMLDVPLLYWGVREPSKGGWLRLNSLTGMMSNANVLYNNSRAGVSIIGNPTDKDTQKLLQEKLELLALIANLAQLNLGVIGEHPEGFYFSAADDRALHAAFGVSLKQYNLAQCFEEAELVEAEDYQSEIDFAKQRVIGLKDDDKVIKFAQFVTVIKQKIAADHLHSLAMKCWPDFFTLFQAAPCGVFSQLTEQGIPTACEADIHGSLSMYVLQELTSQSATYLGDIVHFDVDQNTIVMWHCGFAPYSLANPKTGAIAGVHPNRKIGFALDFGLKAGRVTLFRIGYGPEGYRFMIAQGMAQDVPNSYNGTSAEVMLDMKVDRFIEQVLNDGIEPHFALVYGDVRAQLEQLAKYYKIPVICYE